MKRKGFTLVELLVVIGIIALLMGILLPTLSRVKAYAYRMLCGTNLAGIGKSMLMYSQDEDEQFARAGGKQSLWGGSGYIGSGTSGGNSWDAVDEIGAFGSSSSCPATVTSSFFLLVKHADVSPRQFMCRGDSLGSAFEISMYLLPHSPISTISEAWDFGTRPSLHCSYSYHLPYDLSGGGFGRPLNSASNTACPLAADRNPYLDEEAVSYLDGVDPAEFPPIWQVAAGGGGSGHYYDPDKTGNAAPHQREGQNVMYVDAHVSFEKYPNVGIEYDNIWKYWPGANPDQAQKQVGLPGVSSGGCIPPGGVGGGAPVDFKDAYLVSEDQRVTGLVPSDVRFKTNIRQLTSVLEKVEMIRGVSFEWNNVAESIGIGARAGEKQIGVIAQEVETVFPELISMYKDGYRRVDYAKLTAVLIEAVKELKSENESLKQRIEALEGAKQQSVRAKEVQPFEMN